MTRIEKRLQLLEAKCNQPFLDIEELIRKGLCYDELTDKQKDRFCELCGVPRSVYEEIDLTIFGDLHTSLRKFDPPTPEELSDILTEAKAGTFRNKERNFSNV